MAFGQGFRPLTHIKVEDGTFAQIDKIAKRRRLELLLNPQGDAEYVTAALAQGTRLQIERYLRRFTKRVAEYLTCKTTEDIRVPVVQQHETAYLLINLDEFKALRASKVFKDRLFSVTLFVENKIVGFAFFRNQEVTLVSASNLMLAGTKNILALTVHARASVCINAPLVVENSLKIVSRNLKVSSEGHKPLVSAGQFEVISFEQCQLDAIIEAGNCQFRATEFGLTKPLECQNNITIFAEMTKINASLVAKKAISFFCKDYQDEKLSHIHGQTITIVAANRVSSTGLASSQGLAVYANQIILSNHAYINGDVSLHTHGEAAVIQATETACLYYSGSLSTNSPNTAWFKGRLEHTPDLLVAYKAIINPFQHLTELEKRHLSKHRPPLPLEPSPSYAIKFLPKSPADKPPLYLIEPFSQNLSPKRAETKSHCDMQAAHLYVEGVIVAPPVVRMKASNTLSVSANFSAWHFSVPADFLLQAEKRLECKDSSINTLGIVQLSSNGSVEVSDSEIKAGAISMQAENASFAGSTLLSADKIVILVKDKVEVKPDATVSLLSKQAAFISCKDFESQGTMVFQDLYIKAEGLIKLYRANMRGTNLSLDCQYLLAGFSSFSIENKFLVTALASMIALSHVHAGLYINNSFMDLSSSLYTPAMRDFSPKSGLSLVLAAANTGLSIAQMLVHDPVVQTGLALGRLGLNIIPALFGAIQLANDICKAASQLDDRASIITFANLTKNLFYTLAGLGYSISGLSKFSFNAQLPVSFNPDDLLSTLNKINTAAVPLVALIQNGKSVNSFAALSCDLDLGLISQNDTSLISVHLGESFGFSASHRSVFYIEPNPLSFSITANTSESGLMDLSASPAILPFGAYSKQFLTIDTYAPLRLPQHVSLEAYQLHCQGRQEFVHSSFAVQNVTMEGEFSLEQGSTLTAKTVINNGAKAEIVQSTLHSTRWDNQNGAENTIVASNCYADNMLLSQGTGMQTFASHLNVKELNVQDGALFSAAGYSYIEGENFVFKEQAKIGSATSDWHVGKLSSPGFNLEIDSSDAYKPPKRAESFDYHSSSTLAADFTSRVLIYSTSRKLPIHNEALVSLSDLVFQAPVIEVSGHNSANRSIEFDTPDLRINKAKNDFHGSYTVHADKVSEVNSITRVQGDIWMQGQQLSCQGGSFYAQGNIDLSFQETKAKGTKTVVKEVTKHHGFFSTKKEVRETTYFKNLAFSSDKRITMKGNLDFTGVDLIAHELDLHKAHIVKLCPLQGENTRQTSHTNLLGSKHVDEHSQVESASHLLGKDRVDICTDTLKVNGSNIVGKKVHIQAETLEASASILTSRKKASFTGLSFKLSLPKLAQSPLYTLCKPFEKGASTTATLSDLVRRTTSATNMVGDLLNAAHQKNNLGGLQALTGFNPSVSVSLGKESSYYQQDHKGEGALIAEDLSLDVHNIRFDNDYIVHVSNQAEITADSLSATAAKLHTVYKANSIALVDNISLAGYDYGLSFSHQNLDALQSQGGSMHFNHLKLDANEVNLLGEELTFADLHGRVNHFNSMAGINTQHLSSYNGSIFASGAFTYQQATQQSQTLACKSPLVAEVGTLSSALQGFSVQNLTLVGQEQAGLAADVTQQNPIPVFDVKHSFSLNGSWQDVLALRGTGIGIGTDTAHATHGNSVFSLWDLQTAKDDSFGMQAGSLTTVNSSHHQHYQFTMPIYHANAGDTLLKNWEWFNTAEQNAYLGSQKDTGVVNHNDNNSNNSNNSKEERDPVEKSKLTLDNALLDFDFYRAYQSHTAAQNNWFLTMHPETFDEWHPKIEFDLREIAHYLSKKISSMEESMPFAIAKITLLKSAAWGLFGASAGINLNAIYNADNHFEKTAQIGFLMLTGSVGWEAGVATGAYTAGLLDCAAASLPAAALISGALVSLPAEILMGVCGAIAINIGAEEVWDASLLKIKENIAMDRDSNAKISVLPVSFFNPNLDPSPNPNKFNEHFISDNLFQYN